MSAAKREQVANYARELITLLRGWRLDRETVRAIGREIALQAEAADPVEFAEDPFKGTGIKLPPLGGILPN